VAEGASVKSGRAMTVATIVLGGAIAGESGVGTDASGEERRPGACLGNLLQNAAKFTPAAGHVSLALTRAADGQSIIEVRDDGAGIREELLDRVFEPLVQDERTIAKSQGGLGLGLALVKGLVELHGGTVGVASDGPGRGSVFTVRLPPSLPSSRLDG
jgi:signal transduction histidine kinase